MFVLSRPWPKKRIVRYAKKIGKILFASLAVVVIFVSGVSIGIGSDFVFEKDKLSQTQEAYTLAKIKHQQEVQSLHAQYAASITATQDTHRQEVERLTHTAKVMARLNEPLMAAPGDYGAPQGVFQRGDKPKIIAYIHRQQGFLNLMWEDLFRRAGLQKPEVALHVVAKDEKGDCGRTVRPEGTPFYCTAGKGSIWIPLWPAGRQEVEVMRALLHEYGHNVQDELSVQLGLPGIADGSGKGWVENELIAECLTGVMARSFSMSVEQYVALESAMSFTADVDHGTADQRLSAYRLGREAGTVAACVNRYWITW